MSFNFDLNIENYNIIELRKLLNLEVPFTEREIMENSDNIKNKIINDETLTKEKKEGILNFLLKTENILKKDIENYFSNRKIKFVNNREFLNMPEIDIKPDNSEKFNKWPKGAAVLYYNNELKIYQIYVKTTFSGIKSEWSIFNSQ